MRISLTFKHYELQALLSPCWSQHFQYLSGWLGYLLSTSAVFQSSANWRPIKTNVSWY